MEYSIDIQGLEKSFGSKFKLGPLDLHVPTGSIYGLIGPNGAGKTTTIDLCMNMGKEEAGAIYIFGKHHRNEVVAVKQEIGYVSPDLNFDAWGKIHRLLRYYRKFYPEWDDAYCSELLGKLELKPSDRIKTLSFGGKIKLGLVVALSHRPKLLLLDEPTIGLDAVSKQQIFGELLAAVSDSDRTVLISSHGLSDLERFTDQIGFIRDGQLLLEGATDEVVQRYCLCDYTASGTLPQGRPGFIVQHTEGDRVRAVVDKSADLDAWFASSGLTQISSAPMTLEDLFVALAKEENGDG
ncbi:ABC transporter ATP-binding protein YtrB [Pontiella desulfatans]|uniref:ABC transporter ATP-binding protein YtrB n=1 Tax=Pontiella desulfatans TaxID=2750659 RepID=A0A6C2U9H4_PONDE|nr:ABC transporter ATP-binding protein [Pontiella desulfatans]VGO16748.1 ABC transporter ATP-binding protein YtrB [Pontiella desulfatans]